MSNTPSKDLNSLNHFTPKEIYSPNKDVSGMSKTVYTHISRLHSLLNDWLSVKEKGVKLCKAISALKLYECVDNYYPHQTKPLTESLVEALNGLENIIEGIKIINNQMKALSQLEATPEAIINTWSCTEISEGISEISNMLQSELRLKKVITENIAHCRDENLIEVYASAWEFDAYFNMDTSAYLFAEIRLDLGARQCPTNLSAKQTLPHHPLLELFRRIFKPLFENLWISPECRNFRHPFTCQHRQDKLEKLSEKVFVVITATEIHHLENFNRVALAVHEIQPGVRQNIVNLPSMAHLMRSAYILGAGKDCDGMSLDEGRQSQRPYRYGMVLLCAGALINWLGLAEDYAEPVRYVGVACIVAGALLICAAMCCWLQSPARQPQNDRTSPDTHQIDDPIHVISMPDEETMQQKPPDYDTVAGAPPTYDDAIKLNPARLLPATSSSARVDAPSPLEVTIIPGQLDEALASAHHTALVPVHTPRPPTQVPKTPPPPYRPQQAIR